MKLFLMRHGDAVPAYEDSRRPLSERGRAQVEAVAQRVTGVLQEGLRVLHSPKLRASETAQILCARALPGASPQVSQGLLPGDPVDPWIERIAESDGDLLLVGHNPFMGDLATRLAGKPVGFGTATLVILERVAEFGWGVVGEERG